MPGTSSTEDFVSLAKRVATSPDSASLYEIEILAREGLRLSEENVDLRKGINEIYPRLVTERDSAWKERDALREQLSSCIPDDWCD